MKTSFLFTLIIATTITSFHTHTMEKSIISIQNLSESSSHQHIYKGLNIDIYKQLNISYDFLHKIFALCSYKTRRTAQLTCKQFYYAASINELNKLVTHNFIIGDETEKKLLFKTIIKKNNPTLIRPLLNHAKKEAQLLSQNATYIELDNPTQQKNQEKQYMQNSYLTPLLKEAIEQNNTTMIDRISREENVDADILKEHYNKIRAKKCALISGICCAITTITAVAGGISGFAFWIMTDPCIINKTLHCIDK